ncbi:MAG: ATP-binding protein, partial [Anaerolineaceae bacterium]|nr:ATP-binding protein [Anaerolineaceae bacterium]
MEKSATTNKKKNIQKEKVCPICKGLGYVRRERSIDDPKFGTLELCECQKSKKNKENNQRLYQISNLDAYKEMTFDTFNTKGIANSREINNTLEVAFNTAKNYAHHLNGWLLLIGGFGCGKTHLAAAVANEVVSLGVETLFLTVPDLLDWLRFTFSSNEVTYEKRFEEI